MMYRDFPIPSMTEEDVKGLWVVTDYYGIAEIAGVLYRKGEAILSCVDIETRNSIELPSSTLPFWLQRHDRLNGAVKVPKIGPYSGTFDITNIRYRRGAKWPEFFLSTGFDSTSSWQKSIDLIGLELEEELCSF